MIIGWASGFVKRVGAGWEVCVYPVSGCQRLFSLPKRAFLESLVVNRLGLAPLGAVIDRLTRPILSGIIITGYDQYGQRTSPHSRDTSGAFSVLEAFFACTWSIDDRFELDDLRFRRRGYEVNLIRQWQMPYDQQRLVRQIGPWMAIQT